LKIRLDYVTNSSSSSYIIAYRSLPEFDEETINKYPFLRNYGNLIEKVLFTPGDNDTSVGEVFRTKEEWDQFITEEYGWRGATIEEMINDGEYSAEAYEEEVGYLENGFNILYKSVDYCDSYCSNMIYALAEDKDNFIILEDYG
jgi:hypothetical protein